MSFLSFSHNLFQDAYKYIFQFEDGNCKIVHKTSSILERGEVPPLEIKNGQFFEKESTLITEFNLSSPWELYSLDNYEVAVALLCFLHVENYSTIAFDERDIFWLQRSLPCACMFVALYGCAFV